MGALSTIVMDTNWVCLKIQNQNSTFLLRWGFLCSESLQPSARSNEAGSEAALAARLARFAKRGKRGSGSGAREGKGGEEGLKDRGRDAASEEDGDAEKASGKLTQQRSDVEGEGEGISYWRGRRFVKNFLHFPFFLLLLLFKRKQPISLVYRLGPVLGMSPAAPA